MREVDGKASSLFDYPEDIWRPKLLHDSRAKVREERATVDESIAWKSVARDQSTRAPLGVHSEPTRNHCTRLANWRHRCFCRRAFPRPPFPNLPKFGLSPNFIANPCTSWRIRRDVKVLRVQVFPSKYS